MSERNADRTPGPIFHSDVNRPFQNAGHWYKDIQKTYDTMTDIVRVSFYNDKHNRNILISDNKMQFVS